MVNPTESSDSARPGDDPTPDEEFWLDDGSIVLVAGDTAFKVHKSVLARSSQIFRDMFTASHPETNEQMSGCPVVQMQDSARQLRLLLRALYDSHRYLHPDSPPMPFEEVEALIELGWKYDFHDLRTASVKHLKSIFTDNRGHWSRVEKLDVSQGLSSLHLTVQLADVPSVIRLARLTGESTLLPIAFYLCCRMDIAVLTGRSEHTPSKERLSLEDLQRCFRGMLKLADHFVGGQTSALRDALDFCMDYNADCATGMTRKIAQLADRAWSPACPFLHSRVFAHWVSTFKACDRCRSILRREYETQCALVWEELPTYFELGTWAELRGS